MTLSGDLNICPNSSCYLLLSGEKLTREECDLLREALDEDSAQKVKCDVMSFVEQMKK